MPKYQYATTTARLCDDYNPAPPSDDDWEMCGSAAATRADSFGMSSGIQLFWFWRRPIKEKR